MKRKAWAIVNNRGVLVKDWVTVYDESYYFLTYPQKRMAEANVHSKEGEKVVKVYITTEEEK
jgi:hypothetical protein